jgi:hypothetical protein
MCRAKNRLGSCHNPFLSEICPTPLARNMEVANHCVLALIAAMRTLEKIEAEVRPLSSADQEALRDWLELKDGFKAEIEAGVKDIAAGRYRVHRP